MSTFYLKDTLVTEIDTKKKKEQNRCFDITCTANNDYNRSIFPTRSNTEEMTF